MSRGICSSRWHDEGHSFHSTCPSCGGKGMRKDVEREIEQERRAFERDARAWAVANGWAPPRTPEGQIRAALAAIRQEREPYSSEFPDLPLDEEDEEEPWHQ